MHEFVKMGMSNFSDSSQKNTQEKIETTTLEVGMPPFLQEWW